MRPATSNALTVVAPLVSVLCLALVAEARVISAHGGLVQSGPVRQRPGWEVSGLQSGSLSSSDSNPGISELVREAEDLDGIPVEAFQHARKWQRQRQSTRE